MPSMSRPTASSMRIWARRVRRVARWAGLVLVLLLAVALIDGWRAFGKGSSGERRARMKTSTQWGDGTFVNPQPLANDILRSITDAFAASDHGSPDAPVATVSPPASTFATPPPSGLRVTWLGHSTILVEIDGRRVLTDPVWSERISPSRWVGPTRWYAPPIALVDLPPIDAVVISHDHYDHLDAPTITAMRGWDTTFVVPLGVGAHLAYWGVPEARIVELDWWERTEVRGLSIVCTPARHASGRAVLDTDATLWAGYAFLGDTHRVYFSGDTGLFPAMRDIGEQLGPFDLAMIEVGAYGQAWPDWHLGPEQAVRANQLVRGRVLLPIHWGLFNLAFHGWTEPIERVLAAAEIARVRVAAPRPGQGIEPTTLAAGAPAAVERWWPAVPWRTGAQDPIRANLVDDALRTYE